MAAQLLFAIFLFISFCTEAEPRARSPPPPAGPPPRPTTDHYWLVHTWANGYCASSGSNCQLTPQPTTLTIHGWWSVNSTGHTLLSCVDPLDVTYAFMRDPGDALYNLMTMNWPSLVCPTITTTISDKQCQIRFWSYQYAKHGSCAPYHPDAKRFLITALNLKDKIDLFGALKAGGITSGNSYQTSVFLSAINNKLGTRDVVLRCFWNNQGVPILTEIRVCTSDKDAIACNLQAEKQSDNCGSTKDILFM